MLGAISPFPNTPSWRGAEFKKITGTTLPYHKISAENSAGCYCRNCK
jgi:hypothetical protein